MSQFSVRAAAGTGIASWPMHTSKTVGAIAPTKTWAIRTAAGIRYLYLTSNAALALYVGGRCLRTTISGIPHYAMQAWANNSISISADTTYTIPTGLLYMTGYSPYISYELQGGGGGGQGGGSSGNNGTFTYTLSGPYHTLYWPYGGGGGGGGGSYGSPGGWTTGTISFPTDAAGIDILWHAGARGIGGRGGLNGGWGSSRGEAGTAGGDSYLNLNGCRYVTLIGGFGSGNGFGAPGNLGGNAFWQSVGGGGAGGYPNGGNGSAGTYGVDVFLPGAAGAGGAGWVSAGIGGGKGGNGAYGAGPNTPGSNGDNGAIGYGIVSFHYYTPIPSDG